jgi:hypothetical protein
MQQWPYQIVFKPTSDVPDVVLRQAASPDQATVAFHEERERLQRHRAVGELVVLRLSGEPRTLLREPLWVFRPHRP